VLFEPANESFKIQNFTQSNAQQLEKHPSLLLLKQDQLNANVKLQLEKANLYPALHLGYSNMSIKGIGADDVNYGASKRFQSVQAGFGIPLFFGAQQAKINAEKLLVVKLESDYKSNFLTFQNDYKKAMQQYELNLQKVNYFEKEANVIANEMLKTTMQQYESGSINYLEWAMLQNQIISIKTEYLIAIKDLNNSIIEINYLNNK